MYGYFDSYKLFPGFGLKSPCALCLIAWLNEEVCGKLTYIVCNYHGPKTILTTPK